MNPRPRVWRLAILLAILALVAAACGQKTGVAGQQVSAGDGGTGGFDDFESADGAVDDDFASGDTGDTTGTDTGAVSGGTDGGTTGGGGGGGDTGGQAGGGNPGAQQGGNGGGGGGSAAPAGDRTGISDNEIVIGIHAPVTGAAPIPQNSFDTGKDVYWNFVKANGGVWGSHNVRVVFEDDKFDPRTAVQVCKKMVEQDKAFILIGGGGADQITACANYAQSVGVPYLSAGVNEDGLAGVRAYFALSQTYAQQSSIITQMIAKKQFGINSTDVGIAVADSGSFNDAHASITKSFQDAGFNIVYNKRIPKSASQSEAATIASQMNSAGADVVYFLSSPVTFLNVAAATGPTYAPRWVGPGITSGLNTVTAVGCRAANSVDDAIFLSPFPQLDVIDQVDPNYRKTYGNGADDLGIALWGLNKALHTAFEQIGPTMSRQSLIGHLEQGAPIKSGVFGDLQYSGSNHFGGKASHVLQADCGSATYKTVAQFVTGF